MRNASRKAITIILSFVLLSIPVLPGSNAAGYQVQQRSQNGLSTTTFSTPQGQVVVRLPDDIRAGDMISGTVIAERSRSADSLEGHVIEIDGKQTRLSDKLLTFVAPGAGSMPLILKNAAGTEVGRAVIPIQPASTASSSSFAAPPFGQNGRPLAIHGPFDGDMSNTRCDVGSKPVEVIAESPRKVVIQVPAEPIGPTTITVTEQGNTKTGSFRIIGVNLSAPKTSLMKGEKTTVTVKVTGLEGIKQDVPIDLVTTGSANMQGGNTQQFTIKPKDVQADGIASLTRTITGIKPGSFNVTATVIVPKSPR